MRHKAKFDVEVLYYTLFDVVFLASRNFLSFLRYVSDSFRKQKWSLPYVIFLEWCIFGTKQKFELFFKSYFRMSQKAKM